MTLTIQNLAFWEISPQFILDSRFLFGDRPRVTKFVYQPGDEVLVLGHGRETPTHKALMSSYHEKGRIHTSRWVRGIFLREQKIIYYRQGVLDLGWYDQTTRMLRSRGLPDDHRVQWGPEAKTSLKEALEGYP